MSKRKTPTGQQLKEIRSQLAKLKKAGLYSGDVRGAKGGWRQKSLIKQYSDVIAGKAKTVKVGREAKAFDASFRARKGRVTVKADKGEKVTFSKKAGGLIISRFDRYGIKTTKYAIQKPIRKVSDIPIKPRKGKMFLYQLPNNPRMDYETFVAEYAKYLETRGVKFGSAIEIYEVNASEFGGDDDE